MRILIVAATEKEINPLMNTLGISDQRLGEVISGTYQDLRIDVLITGPGIMATSYVLGRALLHNQKNWSLILNMGIAGSFQKDLQIGEVVCVVQDIQADFGAEDNMEFLPASAIGLSTQDEYEFQNNTPIGNPVLDKLKKTKGVTVNMVHGNETSIKRIKEQLSPDVESMEGAAFFYAVLREKICCMQIRSISNYVEKRDKSKWNTDLAIENLNKVVLKAVAALK